MVHQLCVFHVIKEVNKLILDGVRTVKNRIKRQGKKGRKPLQDYLIIGDLDYVSLADRGII